jgi:hypothetical protein
VHYLLMYDFAPDYLERRGEFRNEHLALAWKAHARGDVVLGGALADPPDSGLLLFQGVACGGRAICQNRPLRQERVGHSLARAEVDDGRRQGCRDSGEAERRMS